MNTISVNQPISGTINIRKCNLKLCFTALSLSLSDPPRLVQGNNITNLTELSDSEEQNLTVAVFDANPPVDNFVVNYVTKNDSGVKIEVKYTVI